MKELAPRKFGRKRLIAEAVARPLEGGAPLNVTAAVRQPEAAQVKLGAIMKNRCLSTNASRLGRRDGFSLMEVMVVLTVMGVLISMAAPSFQRTLEQSRADLAGTNLRAIWAAQRVYWLEYRVYTTDMSALQSLGLIDPTIVSSQAFYTYQIPSADSSTFTATATRVPNARWNGTLAIDDTGQASGALTSAGDLSIVPSYQ
jgi:prepilin-type N-terminal cleavage/methylation domain-containing protein